MVSCEKVINLDVDVTNNGGFVDIAQCLSKLNRKLFRQGMQYVVSEIRINKSGAPNVDGIQIGRIPENYVSTNAWVKGLAKWNEQQLDELREAGAEDTSGKWRDFKVYMNVQHLGATSANNILPSGYGLANISGGTVYYEWAYSKFVKPMHDATDAPQDWNIHMLGTDQTGIPYSVSLIKAYAESRAKPQVPDPNIVTNVDGGFYGDIIDVGNITDEIIENAQQRNNESPYPMSSDTSTENYPGGEFVGQSNDIKGHLEAVSPLTVGRTIIPGFVAPLGLLSITCEGNLEGSEKVQVQLRIAPGNYQGVMAQSMKVAN